MSTKKYVKPKKIVLSPVMSNINISSPLSVSSISSSSPSPSPIPTSMYSSPWKQHKSKKKKKKKIEYEKRGQNLYGRKKDNKGDNSPNEWHKRHGSKNPKYKTELCHRWEQHGTCKYGSRCAFAHGKEELRQCQPVDNHSPKGPRVLRGRKQRNLQIQRSESRGFIVFENTTSEESEEPMAPKSISPVQFELERSESLYSKYTNSDPKDTDIVDKTAESIYKDDEKSREVSRYNFAMNPLFIEKEKQITDWSTEQCIEWAISSNIPKYVGELFTEHEIDGTNLFLLTKNDFRNMGIKIGNLVKLMKALTELKKKSGKPTNPTQEYHEHKLVPFYNKDIPVEDYKCLEDFASPIWTPVNNSTLAN